MQTNHSINKFYAAISIVRAWRHRPDDRVFWHCDSHKFCRKSLIVLSEVTDRPLVYQELPAIGDSNANSYLQCQKSFHTPVIRSGLLAWEGVQHKKRSKNISSYTLEGTSTLSITVLWGSEENGCGVHKLLACNKGHKFQRMCGCHTPNSSSIFA